MEKVDDKEVDNLINAMQDQQNPTRANDAANVANKWLEENELVLLEISEKSLEKLKKALADLPL